MPFVAIVLLALLAGAKAPGRVPAERVQAAIDFGRSAEEAQLRQYPLATNESWEVNFDTPFLRVAQLTAALRKEGKPLPLDEVPERLTRDEVHVYVHARYHEGAELPSVDYVSVQRPGAGGHPETVPARALDRFVRQVPREAGYYGPAHVAHSVRVVFPSAALVAGAQIRILFADRSIQTVTIDAAKLAGAR